ncbi:MAG TPA: PQQ-binding-like beta-propeller repeat protein [Bryobacteraceae bacterium]|nr:PQQ-binding-like beta-propeller repeat protein [Bryobacteraceae bacterium]
MTRLLATIFATFTAFAADPTWPGFRGPLSNPAVSNSNLPEKWSAAGHKTENIEWTADIPGLGWSSPIVAGNSVFITTVVTDGKAKQPQTGVDYSNQYVAELQQQGVKGQELLDRLNARDFELPSEVSLHYFLYSIDLETGKTNWKREFYAGHPPGGRHRKNSFCSETPVTDGKRVYVYITSLGLWAYDLAGNQVWKTPLENLPTILNFGTASSPTLLGNLVVIVNDNEKQEFIAAFDTDTGKQVWRTNRQIHVKGSDRQTGWSTPYVWKNEKRTEIVTIGPGLAISYDPDGKELWRIAGMAAMPIPSPFAYDGLLYLNGGSSAIVAAIKPGATGDLTTPDGAKLNDFVAWLKPRAGTYLPTELGYQGGIYVLTNNGILTRFDAKTGDQTFKARVGGGGDFSASPWGYNGKIFCLNEEGKTFVIRAADKGDKGDKYEELGSNDLDEMTLATPALAGDRVILRTENHLYSIRNKN